MYQVERTILAWLDLKPDEELELEHGEDIDLVLLAADPLEQQRRFEQVRDYTGNVTLNAKPALEALAGFTEHLRANPDSSLRFCYLTTSRVGQEKHSPLPAGLPGIDAWEQIRLSHGDPTHRQTLLEGLRSLLRSRKKPSKFNPGTWDIFKRYVDTATDEQFLQFVTSFEWSTAAPDSHLLTPHILRILVARGYAGDEVQARTQYYVLFFYTFQRLSQQGLKRLTVQERLIQLTAPAIAAPEIALYDRLVEQLSAFGGAVAALGEDSRYIRAGIDKIQGDLSRALSSGGIVPAPAMIREACDQITRHLAAELLRSHTPIQRHGVLDAAERFIASSARYFLILAKPNCSAAPAMVTIAERCRDTGWAALLARGSTFALATLADSIGSGLPPQYRGDWRHTLVTPWAAAPIGGAPGFALLIDGIDRGDAVAILADLTRLNDALVGSPAGRFKVIIACDEIAWERLRNDCDLLADAGRPAAEDIAWLSELGDYTEEERDLGLRLIGATDLLMPALPGAEADPHVEVLLDLLLHPPTFDTYAELRRQRADVALNSISRTTLVQGVVDAAIGRAAALCQIHAGILRDWLIQMAELLRVDATSNHELDANVLKVSLPQLYVNRLDPAHSPYRALGVQGLLGETTVAMKRMIRFKLQDVNAYFLSHALEARLRAVAPEETDAFLDALLQDMFGYPLLFDAVVMWLDRLLEEGRGEAARDLAIHLTESYVIQAAVLFRLAAPPVLSCLFDAVVARGDDLFLRYAQAARAVRRSTTTVAEVRRRLRSKVPVARRLAAAIIDIHRDESSLPLIVDLLGDADEDVRGAAFGALSAIGTAGLADVLALIRDAHQPPELRSRGLAALRGIGYLDEQVSGGIEACLRIDAGEPKVLQAALLAAAHLRDATEARHAAEALGSDDAWTVMAAGKYLREVPAAEAAGALRVALLAWNTDPGGRGDRDRVLRQLLAAAVQAGELATAVRVLRDSIAGTGQLSPVVALWSAADLNIVEGRALLLEHLSEQLDGLPPNGSYIHTADRLADTWLQDQLHVLHATTVSLLHKGIDVAGCLSDAIIHGLVTQETHFLRDPGIRSSLFRILIKCRPATFVPEVCRIIPVASWPFIREVSEALWIAGDESAEGPLLNALAREEPDEGRAMIARAAVMRALGKCAGRGGAEQLCGYIEAEVNAERYLPEESFSMLVERGVLTVERLEGIVSNEQATPSGRIAALCTLSEVRSPGLPDLLRTLATQSDAPNLRWWSVRLLGRCGGGAAVPDLLRLLRTTLDGGLAAEAAESLSLLGIVESVPHIESALDAFTDSEHVHKFAAALARFGTPSSLALVLSAMERTRYPSKRCLMIDVLGAWLPMEPARRTLTEALTLRSSHSIFRGEQRAAINAFVDHDPAFLIRQVARLYRKGNLEDQSAGALAYHIVSLARGAQAASDDLLDLLQLLSTDRRLEVREKAADALSMVDPIVTRRVLARLHSEGGVWEQACAVTILGYCDSDIEGLKAAQRAPAFLVRHAADTAIDVRQRRQQCGVLVSQFATLEGVARLSAYLCLCEHGDPQALRRYNAALDAREDMRHFKRQISSKIWDRYTKDQEKRAKEQLDLFENLGTIHFD